MKTENNVIALLLLCFVAFMPKVNAQQKGPDRQRPFDKERIAKDLQVSDERAKKIAHALTYNKEAISTVLKNNSMPPDKKQILLKSLFDQRIEYLEKTLTVDELSRLRDLQVEERSKAKGRRLQIESKHKEEVEVATREMRVKKSGKQKQ